MAAATFADLPLHADVQRALARMRFRAPSPVQLRALPLALFGSDVVAQAKSGTGKTGVFAAAAVERVVGAPEALAAQVAPLALLLAPTREVAAQIAAVVQQVAHFRPDVAENLRRGCHIAIGTPGRVKALVEQRALRCHALRLLVLDEVDKLLQSDFESELHFIVAALPERRQTLAFSATFTTEQLAAVVRMMRSPQIVRVRGPQDTTVELVSTREELATWTQREAAGGHPELWLRHVKQFYSVVTRAASSSSGGGGSGSDASAALDMGAKVAKLASLLAEVVFSQCMVFCNDKLRAEALATALAAQGWPAVCITGAQPQAARSEAMAGFRAFRSRVLVSTDLTARGIDVDRVNFVVNLDLPRDPATYLHRVGRAGRFGGRGLAVTLLAAEDVGAVEMLARVFGMSIAELPTPVPRAVSEFVRETTATRSEDVGSAAEALPRREPAEEQQAARDGPTQNASPRVVAAGASSPEQLISTLAWEEACYERWLTLL
ncbi:hypothetical protein PybrP1_004418 [[Pythium] brassicae (nom. inval.)]|nr:hypothetical protein PybrP1_004418 [[Pythium] brassicae (nom. inval.)]